MDTLILNRHNGRGTVISTYCDVCVILDGDKTDKPCMFCGLCGKWICDRCRPNKWRRGLAAFSDKVTSMFRVLKPNKET